MSIPVLVVEDDPLIASSLARALRSKGYEPTTCATLADALGALDPEPPRLVLLDLGLPDGDGTDLAVHMARHHPSIPVIAVTARAEEIDVVLGLEAGAVDYVTKPFRLAELLARISSHLRQAEAYHGGAGDDGRTLTVGSLVVDVAARRVTVDGVEVALRPKEFDLLERLAREPGTVVTREVLIDEVWDENWWGSTRTLDVHINALRRKLGDGPGGPSRIATIRGVGYRLEAEP